MLSRKVNMVELSRRRFLIGTAATLAVATLPSFPTSLCQLEKPGKMGWLHRFDFEFTDPEDTDVAATLTMSRDDIIMLQMAMNQRAYYVWRAPLGCELVLAEKHPLALDVNPATSTAKLTVWYSYSGEEQVWKQVFNFVNGRPVPEAEPAPLYLLESRA